MDSGCSRHMTGDSSLLTQLVEITDPTITFGDDGKGYTKRYGLIIKDNVLIDEIALLSGLKHNLFNISRVRDKWFNVKFTQATCVISQGENNNVVMADFNLLKSNSITCLFSKAST